VGEGQMSILGVAVGVLKNGWAVVMTVMNMNKFYYYTDRNPICRTSKISKSKARIK
jgi:hypothetical protein